MPSLRRCQRQNRFFPGDIGDRISVIPGEAALQCCVFSVSGEGMLVELHTDRLTQDVCLTVRDRSARFSDNAFDMDAGETRQITVSLAPDKRAGNPVRVCALNAAPSLLKWTAERKGM